MRNIFMLYMPPLNPEAMVHYRETIRQKVAFGRIVPFIDSSLNRHLREVFGERHIAVWGSRNTPMNRGRFDRMEEGDEILIVEGDIIRLLGKIAGKTVSRELSQELWHNLRPGHHDTWELIYFIANPREINLPFRSFNELLGYEPEFRLHGFSSVAEDKLKHFYSRYDDLYEILMGLTQGRTIERVREPLPPSEIEQPTEAADVEAESLPAPDPGCVSDHLQMQWTLLKLGKQGGERVWAPRSDQTRITSAFQFSDFEPTLAAGLDTQVRYVENIDVVWKEEFRIDAAFEIENSTAIYSGLLRLSDLTMVAPNSLYPLFIVAPGERKNRVREQLIRPTFRNLHIAEKVLFLSYEKVREIDDFFGEGPAGPTPDILSAKAEKLSA
jgi:hypothetical protein